MLNCAFARSNAALPAADTGGGFGIGSTLTNGVAGVREVTLCNAAFPPAIPRSINVGPRVFTSTVVSSAVCKRCSCAPNEVISVPDVSRVGCVAVILSFAGLLAVGVSGVIVLGMFRLRISAAIEVVNFSEALAMFALLNASIFVCSIVN